MSRLGKALLLGAVALLGGAMMARSAAAQDADRLTAGNPATAPLKWAGLWGVRNSPESMIHCTAQFISSRVILTAAHCVRDQYTGEYYDPANKNTYFLLQFQNDNWSHSYRPLCKVTWSGWVVRFKPGEDPEKKSTWSKETHIANQNAKQWDYAFVYLDGESITGHYNYDVKHFWRSAWSTGYPGKLMEGAVIQTTEGEVFDMNVLKRSAFPGVLVLWHGSIRHTQGSSGGAWVANFNKNEGKEANIIIGLNSFGNPLDRPGASFGPNFSDRFTKLLDFASSGCK
jgi:hypothetical protein